MKGGLFRCGWSINYKNNPTHYKIHKIYMYSALKRNYPQIKVPLTYYNPPPSIHTHNCKYLITIRTYINNTLYTESKAFFPWTQAYLLFLSFFPPNLTSSLNSEKCGSCVAKPSIICQHRINNAHVSSVKM